MKPYNDVLKLSSGSSQNIIYKMCLEILYLIYMYKMIWHQIPYNT